MLCEIIVRDIKADDFSALSGLLGELGYPSTPNEVADRLNKIINNSDYKTYVAEVDGIAVGFIGLCKSYAYEISKCYIRIIALVVNEQYRKCGIGTKLIHAAEKWANVEEAGFIVVASGVQRKSAHTFYNKRGFINSTKDLYFCKSL